jgi:hypothetical protein
VKEIAEATYYEIVTDELSETGWENEFYVKDFLPNDVLCQVDVISTDNKVNSVKLETFTKEINIDEANSNLEVSCYMKSETATNFRFKIKVSNSDGTSDVISSPDISINSQFSRYSYMFTDINVDAKSVLIQFLFGGQTGSYTLGLINAEVKEGLAISDYELSSIRLKKDLDTSELEVFHSSTLKIQQIEMYDSLGRLMGKSNTSKIKYNSDLKLAIVVIYTDRGVISKKVLLD